MCSTTTDLRVHHAKEGQEWLHQDRFEVIYLPAYAPQNNLVEYLNENFKKGLRSSERSSSKDELLK